MKKYQVFCRANKKGSKWFKYSGIINDKEEAADALLLSVKSFENIECEPVTFCVKRIETKESGSRSAECICFTDLQADVYEQVKKARKERDNKKLNDIRDYYGNDIYTWALNEINKREERIISILWEAACCGKIDILKAYYENGGKVNRRYYKFGICHSLIAGAFRNGEMEAVEYLKSKGETTEGAAEEYELKEIKSKELIK